MPRAIRRDVPTNTIRKAFAAGTRDRTGRPGASYWQLQTDYVINVRLDPATQTLTGTETISLKNNSPDPLPQIVLRLDHNIFRPRAPFASSWVPGEITEGMVITKLVVNGDAPDVTAAATTGRAGTAGAGRVSASSLNQTVATINLPAPIPAKGQATIEIGWRTKFRVARAAAHGPAL